MLDRSTHPMAAEFIDSWRAAASKKEVKLLDALLSPSAILVSPISFKPVRDRREILAIFTAILHVLPDLKYGRCEATATGAIMVFEGTLDGGLQLEGIDVFTLTDGALAAELKVFVRPLRSAQAFAEAMTRKLGGPA